MLLPSSMRKLWPLLAVPLGAIALAALVGALRRDSLASTPGDVVERFLDKVTSERYEKASPFLAGGAGRRDSPARLKEWGREVGSGLGKVRHVRGETDWISGDDAEATGILVAGNRERRLRFSLRRDGGRWRIARLDDFWTGNGRDRTSEPRAIRIRERWRDRRSRAVR